MSTPTLQTLSSCRGRVFVLLSHEKKLRVVELAAGQPVRSTSVPAGMWLSTAYVEGDAVRLALSSQRGKTHFVAPGSGEKGRSLTIATAGTGPAPKRGYVGDLKTVAGRPMLVGSKGQIYVWNGQQWSDEREALLQHADLAGGSIDDLADAAGDPVILLQQDRDHSRIFVQRGGTWWPCGLLGTAKAIAWRASDSTLFAVGEGAWALSLTEEAPPRELSAVPTKLWAAAVFRDTLFASDLNRVFVLEGDRFEEVLGSGESGAYNHGLSVHDDRLYLVRRNALEIFDGRRWTSIPATDFAPRTGDGIVRYT